MLLLELCRALLARAGADDAVPTPVILNLASWMARREPLAVWAVRELQRVYDVATAIGAAWLEANALALLLDGLDEGPPEERGAQIAGINAFRQQSLCPVAVCSRTDDYEGVEAHLRLGGAIAIRPITQEQIDSVLSQAGEAGAATRESLARHQMLDGAVETPLLLNVLLQIRTVGKQLGQDHILQQELWRAYADAVLARRSELRPGEATAIHKRLAWVAAHLQRAGDDTIRLEELNEGWLPEQNRFLVRWVFPALGLMVVALFGYFLRWLVADGLTARGLELGLLQRIAPAVNALNAVVVAGFAAAFARDRIDTLEWSWADARRFLPWTPLALLGAFAMANLNATGSLRSFALFGLIALGVTIVVSLAITVGLGLRPTVIPTLAPGQVLSRAARTGALLGFGSLVFGLISGLLGGLLIYGLFSWLDGIPLRATLGNVIQSGRNGLNIGYLIGLALGLYFGGYATLRHWAIRLSLVISGTLPLRLVRFLDRCVERALLRQVGSGYSFTHKLLLEHYAARDKTDDTDGTSGGTAQALDHTL